MEALEMIFGAVHSLSSVVIVLLVLVTLAVCAVMINIFRNDSNNTDLNL